MRDVKKKDFVGKTIKSVNINCENVIGFKFEDGTAFDLYAECGGGPYAIPFFWVDDDKDSMKASRKKVNF